MCTYVRVLHSLLSSTWLRSTKSSFMRSVVRSLCCASNTYRYPLPIPSLSYILSCGCPCQACVSSHKTSLVLPSKYPRCASCAIKREVSSETKDPHIAKLSSSSPSHCSPVATLFSSNTSVISSPSPLALLEAFTRTCKYTKHFTCNIFNILGEPETPIVSTHSSSSTTVVSCANTSPRPTPSHSRRVDTRSKRLSSHKPGNSTTRPLVEPFDSYASGAASSAKFLTLQSSLAASASPKATPSPPSCFRTIDTSLAATLFSSSTPDASNLAAPSSPDTPQVTVTASLSSQP